MSRLGSRVMLGIPTLSTARRSTAWLDAISSLGVPLGSSIGRVWVEDMPVAAARNRICQTAIDNNVDYLLFVSDDVLPPPNILLAMLDKIGREFPTENGQMARASMITGVYWTKGYPSEPYLWNGLLKGTYKDWTVGEFFPVDFAGCDALMIEVEMLKQLPQPWFSTEWTWEPGQQVSPIATEDFYFYSKAREHGFRLFADTAIQCFHEDRSTGMLYGLTTDMFQAGGTPEYGTECKIIADIGAGLDTPYFGPNTLITRFDGRADTRPDVRCDITRIPPNHFGKYQVVHARHVLEHFPRREAPKIVAHWAELVSPGGELVIRVPNIEYAFDKALNGTPDEKAYAWNQIYGAQTYPYDFHKNGFTPRKLETLLSTAGSNIHGVTVELEDDGQNICGRARVSGPAEVEALTDVWDRIDAQEGRSPSIEAPITQGENDPSSVTEPCSSTSSCEPLDGPPASSGIFSMADEGVVPAPSSAQEVRPSRRRARKKE